MKRRNFSNSRNNRAKGLERGECSNSVDSVLEKIVYFFVDLMKKKYGGLVETFEGLSERERERESERGEKWYLSTSRSPGGFLHLFAESRDTQYSIHIHILHFQFFSARAYQRHTIYNNKKSHICAELPRDGIQMNAFEYAPLLTTNCPSITLLTLPIRYIDTFD